MPSIKLYIGLFILPITNLHLGLPTCFPTCPTTYRKDCNRVIYRIGGLEENSATTWYRREEKLGRLDISWKDFETFLLDDLFPSEIRLQDVHKKYQEVHHMPGQDF